MSTRIAIRAGRDIDPINPDPADIHLDDIAHHLSQICRFTGAPPTFYSVAQHSIYAATEVFDRTGDHTDALWALLHDASEAYLSDLARPIKAAFGIGELYRQVESKLMAAICEKFNLPVEQPEVVTQVDDELLITERDAFGLTAGVLWPDAPTIPWVMRTLTNKAVYQPPWVYGVFLDTFEKHARGMIREAA